MIVINPDQKVDTLNYFRTQMPEFATITDAVFNRELNSTCIYVPEFIQKHLRIKYNNQSQHWMILREILINWVAHRIVLKDLLAQAAGEEALPEELVRTANSLSEGGLSVSYAQAEPSGETPEALYDYLTNTAYGRAAKILIEQCLTGAKGVFCV